MFYKTKLPSATMIVFCLMNQNSSNTTRFPKAFKFTNLEKKRDFGHFA